MALKYNKKAKKAIGVLMVIIREYQNTKATDVNLILILLQTALATLNFTLSLPHFQQLLKVG